MRLLILVILLCAARLMAADLAGSYRASWSVTPAHYSSDGTVKKLPARTVDCSVEFRPDLGLRIFLVTDNEAESATPYWGAWKLVESRLYYLVQMPVLDRVHSWYGASLVRLKGDTLMLSDFLTGPLVATSDGTLVLKRGPALDFPSEPPSDFAAQASRELERVLAAKSSVEFVGATSEAELLRRSEDAFQASDAAELMRLTYAVVREYLPDHDSDTEEYLRYAGLFALPGALEFQRETKAEALATLEKSKDCVFPPSVSVEGIQWVKRRHGSSSGGKAIFYGLVKGKWALLTGPVNEEAVKTLIAKRKGAGER